MTHITELLPDTNSGETITITHKRYMELLGKEAAFDPETVFVRHVNDGRMIPLGKDWTGESYIIFPENPSVKHIDWIMGAIDICSMRQMDTTIADWMERKKVPLNDRAGLSETIKRDRKSFLKRLKDACNNRKEESNG